MRNFLHKLHSSIPTQIVKGQRRGIVSMSNFIYTLLIFPCIFWAISSKINFNSLIPNVWEDRNCVDSHKIMRRISINFIRWIQQVVSFTGQSKNSLGCFYNEGPVKFYWQIHLTGVDFNWMLPLLIVSFWISSDSIESFNSIKSFESSVPISIQNLRIITLSVSNK